ncbi:MAG: VOC family protein [Gemmatimonadales bacterium]
MNQRVVAMIHVPRVQETVAWYETIGFTVADSFVEDGEMNWARLTFGESDVMFNAGGRPGTQPRREVDLYLHTLEVDVLYERLKDRADVIEGVHDTFYGMREFAIRDPNGFWVVFGQAATRR